jgi:hypothetical protein
MKAASLHEHLGVPYLGTCHKLIINEEEATPCFNGKHITRSLLSCEQTPPSHCGVVKKHAPIFAIPLEGIQSEGDDFTMKEGIIKLLLAFGGLSIPRRLVKNPNS